MPQLEFNQDLTMFWFRLVMSFLFGAAVGSFLNVVIARLPLGESIVFPGSKCPKCGNGIAFYDNIPIFSYLWLMGRCRSCGGSISIRYPLIELITAFTAVAITIHYTPGVTALLYFIFCAEMIAIFFIDLDHLIIPDVFTLTGIPIGFIAATLGYFPEMDWKYSLIGTVLGIVILWLPAKIYMLLRKKEGLGLGDVKLLGMIGAYLGPYGVVFVLFLSSLTGSLSAIPGILLKRADTNTPIPFGPFITTAAILYVFYGLEIIDFFFGAQTIMIFQN